MNMYEVMRVAAQRLLELSNPNNESDWDLAMELIEWSKSNNPVKQEECKRRV